MTHPFQTLAQSFIHHILQRGVSFFLDPLQHRSHIIIKRQRRPHTSRHNTHDALMSINNPTAGDNNLSTRNHNKTKVNCEKPRNPLPARLLA
jgi:hypothetical protein